MVLKLKQKCLVRKVTFYLRKTEIISKFKFHSLKYNSNSRAAMALIKLHYDSLDKREIENLNRLFDEMTPEQILNLNRL